VILWKLEQVILWKLEQVKDYILLWTGCKIIIMPF